MSGKTLQEKADDARRLQDGEGPESDTYWAQAAEGQNKQFQRMLRAAREQIRFYAKATKPP